MLKKGVKHLWPVPGKVPLGRPECGFENELCRGQNWVYVISGSGASVLLMLVIIMAIVMFRLEEYLAGLGQP